MKNYKLIPVQRNCPVCYSAVANILWTVSSSQAAQHFVLKEADSKRFLKLVSHIEGLWKGGICEVVRCDKCGFCYSNPYVAGDKQFYDLAYGRCSYPVWKWEYRLTYEVLIKYIEPECKLLEIGAGDGAFVKRIARDLMLKKNILCTEFSEYGRYQIQQCGIECLSEDVRNLTAKDLKGSYDAVCMFQVLEHTDRLDALFKRLNWLMKKGASLFIAVPNLRRIQFNELNGALLDMPPNHVGRWNKKCFEEIGRRTGFYIDKYEVERLNFIPMAKTFLTYSFLQKSQQPGTLANKIRRIKNRYLRKAMQVAGAAFSSITALPALSRIKPDMGRSQWVRLIKLDE